MRCCNRLGKRYESPCYLAVMCLSSHHLRRVLVTNWEHYHFPVGTRTPTDPARSINDGWHRWWPVVSINPHPSLAWSDATPQHQWVSPSPASPSAKPRQLCVFLFFFLNLPLVIIILQSKNAWYSEVPLFHSYYAHHICSRSLVSLLFKRALFSFFIPPSPKRLGSRSHILCFLP